MGWSFIKATHGGWRIRPMAQQPSKENIQPNLDNSSLNGSTSETFSKIKDISGNEINPSKLPNIRLSSENIGDLRFGLTQWFNNRQKYNPQIALTDAPTLYSKVQYNLPMEMFYQNAANKFRRLGARAATSDSVRNFAQQLEAESAAVGQEERGRLANLDTYNTTSQRAQKFKMPIRYLESKTPIKINLEWHLLKRLKLLLKELKVLREVKIWLIGYSVNNKGWKGLMSGIEI